MKRRTIITVATVLLLTGFTTNGEFFQKKDSNEGGHQEKTEQQGKMTPEMGLMQHEKRPCMISMMLRGMQHRHQGAFAKNHNLMVNLFPGIIWHLGLSSEKAEEMIDLRTSYKKQLIDHEAELTKTLLQLQQILRENTCREKTKVQMLAIAEIRIKMKILVYESVIQMQSLLNYEQRKKLEKLMNLHHKHENGIVMMHDI